MRSILIAGMFSLLLAGTAQEIVIPAAEFSATSVPPEQQKLIRAAGNLSGRSGDGGEPRVNGWFDYDFAVPETGWYEIVLPVTADRYEFLLDGCDYQYGDGTFYISAGKHRLRLRQEIYWTPFGKIDRIVIRPAAPELAKRLNISEATGRFVREAVLKEKDVLKLKIRAGAPQPAVLEAVVRSADREIGRYRLEIPARDCFEGELAIPASEPGVHDISFEADGKPLPEQPLFRLAVVGKNRPALPVDGPVRKELLAEIDCVKQAPDHSGGGATRLVRKSFGSYRESGPVSWLTHMNSREPSFFAYKFTVPEPQKLYLAEIDYPDDAFRTYAIAVRDSVPADYPIAGGVDTGHEYPLTNGMLTHSLLFRPNSTDLRLLVANARDGVRAAAAKIRIYRVEGDALPPLLPTPDEGRGFANWYEEGSNFAGMYGADRRKGLPEYLKAADRWAQTMAFIGADTLWPTLAVYQFGLYPSAYNCRFTSPASSDLAEVILLNAEKYGLHAIFDFHPEARELVRADEANRLRNKNGRLNRYPAVCWGPLHPDNRAWTLGLVREFAQRYAHSPAFKGISLRNMQWANPALNNFHSLDWGYDDFTVGEFERETGIRLPVKADDPDRFELRHTELMKHHRDRWIDWRCEKIAELYRELAGILRQARPDLSLYVETMERGAGVDPGRLAAIDGVVVFGGSSYGRRGRGENNRERFLQMLLKPEPGVHAFRNSGAYFEATGEVIPPESLGYPADTRRTWMSAIVNPAGRNVLERWALSLGIADAQFLADGANTYTVGQPLLREFLREYRRLPKCRFTPRQEAREPVAVWTGPGCFYAVNLMPFPAECALEFSPGAEVSGLADGKPLPLSGGNANLTLAAYQLRAFQLDGELRKAAATVPSEELRRFRAQLAAIREALPGIPENRRPALRQLADRLAKLLDAHHYWSFRTELELAAGQLHAAGILPPFYFHDGWPVPPEGALAGDALLRTASGGRLVPSGRITPDFQDQQVLVSKPGESLKLRLPIPATGLYRLRFGYVSGREYGSLAVRGNGETVGKLISSGDDNTARDAMLITPVPFRDGTGELELVPESGKSAAISYLELTPIYTPVPPLRWRAGAAVGMDTPPPSPQEFRNWKQLQGLTPYVDVSCGEPPRDGLARYAVTWVHSPDARKVRLSYGVDYRARIWVNRKAVKPTDDRTKEGTPGRGEDQLDFELRPGWNEFLVRCGSGSGGFGFWMEFSNLDDLRFSATPGGGAPVKVEIPQGKTLHHQDFEKKVEQTPKTVWDGSGRFAVRGQGAARMGNYFAGSKVDGGKFYQLQAYCRGVRDNQGSRVQINWQDVDGKLIRYDLVTPALTTDYQCVKLARKAPANAATVHLIVGTDNGGEWVDEVWFGEIPALPVDGI